MGYIYNSFEKTSTEGKSIWTYIYISNNSFNNITLYNGSNNNNNM